MGHDEDVYFLYYWRIGTAQGLCTICCHHKERIVEWKIIVAPFSKRCHDE
jgi:hypothetical protein